MLWAQAGGARENYVSYKRIAPAAPLVTSRKKLCPNMSTFDCFCSSLCDPGALTTLEAQ